MNMFVVSNYIGVLGVCLILGAYFLLQLEKWHQKSIQYSILNATGSILIIISLYYHFNLSSLIIEIAWTGLSVYGIAKWLMQRKPSLRE